MKKVIKVSESKLIDIIKNIILKESANDPFSPLYWYKRFGTW